MLPVVARSFCWMVVLGTLSAVVAAGHPLAAEPSRAVVIERPWTFLDGPWRFQLGDDPRWAAPEFDDSSWEVMDLTPAAGAHDADVGLTNYSAGWYARGHYGYMGYAWYRTRIRIEAASDLDVALLAPAYVEDAYQIVDVVEPAGFVAVAALALFFISVEHLICFTSCSMVRGESASRSRDAQTEGRRSNAEAQHETGELLARQTQELLDAVTAGNTAVWDRYVDGNIIYLAEDGTRKSKTDLLAELSPLPTGISGSLKVGSFQMQLHGMTAIATHDDVEMVNYFGHPLKAEYRTTDTWISTPAGLKLIASQVHARLFDPPEVQLPASKLDEYRGVYRLNADVTYVIRRDGSELRGERTGRPPQRLSIEVADVMFVAGQPRTRKVFLRTPDGRISGFVDRREGLDVPWRKIAD